ncbi:protein of unknown function [Clostridium beijerinckii]|nr:protein of unknown function [Clostridium beijerinckii]
MITYRNHKYFVPKSYENIAEVFKETFHKSIILISSCDIFYNISPTYNDLSIISVNLLITLKISFCFYRIKVDISNLIYKINP